MKSLIVTSLAVSFLFVGLAQSFGDQPVDDQTLLQYARQVASEPPAVLGQHLQSANAQDRRIAATALAISAPADGKERRMRLDMLMEALVKEQDLAVANDLIGGMHYLLPTFLQELNTLMVSGKDEATKAEAARDMQVMEGWIKRIEAEKEKKNPRTAP